MVSARILSLERQVATVDKNRSIAQWCIRLSKMIKKTGYALGTTQLIQGCSICYKLTTMICQCAHMFLPTPGLGTMVYLNYLDLFSQLAHGLVLYNPFTTTTYFSLGYSESKIRSRSWTESLLLPVHHVQKYH